MLFERLIALCIGTLLLATVSQWTASKLDQSMSAISLLIHARLFQSQCHMRHEDGSIAVTDTQCQLQSPSQKQSIDIRSPIKLSMNRQMLGIKPNLNTKYAGSLKLEFPNNTVKLTLAPGLAWFRWYP